MNALVDACRDLDHVPGNLNDDHARTFFTTFPLDSLFGSVGLTRLPSMTVSTDAITNLNKHLDLFFHAWTQGFPGRHHAACRAADRHLSADSIAQDRNGEVFAPPRNTLPGRCTAVPHGAPQTALGAAIQLHAAPQSAESLRIRLPDAPSRSQPAAGGSPGPGHGYARPAADHG